MSNKKYKINVSVQTHYLGIQSNLQQHHVFAYTITISNKGKLAARLISRCWLITDAEGETQEVKGEGVVGEQPYIKPGENFTYTSYAIINTPVGSMGGSYQMVGDDGNTFEIHIPIFSLADPLLLH